MNDAVSANSLGTRLGCGWPGAERKRESDDLSESALTAWVSMLSLPNSQQNFYGPNQ
jgi:hypothetical protein